MKKPIIFRSLIILFVLSSLISVVVLSSCGSKNNKCDHEWFNATCLSSKTCKICQATEGEPLGHDLHNEVVIKPVTCTTDGEIELTCSRCNAILNEVVKATGHTYSEATCTDAAVCSGCNITNGEALGHLVNNWQLVLESTCSTDGVQEGFCERCQTTVQSAIARKDHNWNNSDPQECSECHAVKGDELVPTDDLEYHSLVSYLDQAIPDNMTDNFTFFTAIENSRVKLTWSSSDVNHLTHGGIVKRDANEHRVTITVTMEYPLVTFKYQKEVVIMPVQLKPIKDKMTIAYLYEYTYKTPSESDLAKVDYINYCFGNIVGTNVTFNNPRLLEQVLSFRNQGVRVAFALGGWGGEGFSDALKTAESRTAFVNSLMRVIKQYQFDGFDIDWEYPTSSVAGIKSDPNDRENLTLFCKELKAAMLAYRSDLLLTIAIAPSNQFYDLKELTKYVDYFNIMAYDFAMGTTALHQSNLYNSSYSTSSSAHNSVSIVSQYVPSNKIVIGTAFYGRTGNFATTANAKIGGSLSTDMTKTFTYTKIKEYIDLGWEELWDEVACAPYIIKGVIFITYDNARSTACKAQYVIDNNLGGIMFWDISQDTTGDLLTAIDTTFNPQE